MAYDYSDLLNNAQRWAEQALAAGWINRDSLHTISDVELQAPAALFDLGQSRPLIVAFMGGTGVGKSSLLNRLAGKAIAKAGVERPTSREVTLYHHHTVILQHLPAQFPVDQVNIAPHQDDTSKHIVWIDMPDIDSTEQANKHQVLQWLPHIDVLIYVVSPERYRDNKAWRLLLAEGGKHAWLFVFNQWDRGQAEQYQDFIQQLQQAGFNEPIIFKTICDPVSLDDEFESLKSTLVTLATQHTIEQLEQRGLQVRTQELAQRLQQIIPKLGDVGATQQLVGLWQQQWQRSSKLLQQGFVWPIQQAASYYAEHTADLITHPSMNQIVLWDTWAQSRLDDTLDEFISNAKQLGMPAAPIRQQLTPIREQAEKITRDQSALAVREALANPGNLAQRLFLKTMRLAEILLPLTVMAWVGYQVFMGYYTSNITHSQYLGVDFAIHSILAIALSWLIPFFVIKKAQPSLKKTAIRGLNKGLNQALTTLEISVSDSITVIVQQHAEQIRQLLEIIQQCAKQPEKIRQPAQEKGPLARMLVD